jgi:uncharacterized membrane protein YgcG
MSGLRPTPEQERWMEIAARVGAARSAPWAAERTEGWVRPKLITRCALFVLGAVTAALTAAVFGFTRIPGYGWIVGLVLIAAAEGLVMRRQLFGAGIEEALELAGLLMIVFQVQNHGIDPFGVRYSLLLAATLAIAAFRFLNPLFLALSAAAVSCAFHVAGSHAASIFCFAAASMALLGGGIEFRRPSYDRMLDWLVVTMPLCGYLWLAEGSPAPVLPAHAPLWLLVPFGAAALIVGIRRRAHAPLAAFMVCIACMAYELRNVTGLPLEARLIFWGAAALLLSLGLGKYLRTPRGGVSSNREATDDELSDLLQLAGAGALAPQSAHGAHGAHAAHEPRAEFKGGGGTGGGGGASGAY